MLKYADTNKKPIFSKIVTYSKRKINNFLSKDEKSTKEIQKTINCNDTIIDYGQTDT